MHPTMGLKHLKRTTATDVARLRLLLSGIELGDRSPFQLLRHMRSLVASSILDNLILIPANTTADDLPLNKLAELTDNMHESFFKISTDHVAEASTASVSSNATLGFIDGWFSDLVLSISHFTCDRMRNRRYSSRSRPPSNSRIRSSRL